eukprot:1159987-Pelagomonas_calceolata.AAC.1
MKAGRTANRNGKRRRAEGGVLRGIQQGREFCVLRQSLKQSIESKQLRTLVSRLTSSLLLACTQASGHPP